MQIININFNGLHPFIIPDGELARCCVAEIVEGRCYPLSMLIQPKVVVDIGAHVGEYTIMAALMWPKATIHAYEPCHEICEVLRENLKKFPNVVIHEEAVAGHAGKQLLHHSGFGTVCHSLHLDRLPQPTGKAESVECVGAAEIAALEPDILKIDCEGTEDEIFNAFWHNQIERIQQIHFEYHTDAKRISICRLLDETHVLAHAHILKPGLGELTYERRI